METKLDLEKSKIYTYENSFCELGMCADLYIDKKGYFSDTEDFSTYKIGTLSRISLQRVPTELRFGYRPFITHTNENKSVSFRFFMPLDKVVKVCKYRPFKNIDEFLLKFKPSEIITFRKINGSNELSYVFLGYETFNKELYVKIGLELYTFEQLFNEFEFFDNKNIETLGKWLPFGIEG